jgi:hypothetical protein
MGIAAVEPKRLNLNLWIGVLSTATLVLVLFFFDPSRSGFYPLCYFHRVTGLLCPGCGGLRATHQLLHGHILEALRLNAFLVLVLLPAACFIGLRWLIRFLQQKPNKLEFRLRWLWLGLGSAVVFGIARNLL